MISIPARLKPVIDNLNRFSVWLLLLTIGWLAWTIARLLWLILAPPTAPALQMQPLQNNTASNADTSSLFAIFEDPEPVTAAPKPPPNVNLKGVLLAIPESLSSALLDVEGEVKNYRINESLQDSGYILVAVDWNAVVIADASGNETVISMADSMPLDQSDMAAGNVSNQRLPNNEPVDNLQPMPLPNAISNDNVVNTANSPNDGSDSDSTDSDSTNNNNGTGNASSAIDEAVTALQDSPASYLSRMGVMAAGEGYQVTAAMPAGIRNRLGLEPGDRVLKVNGQNIGSDPTQDAGLLKQVQQSGEAQIEVKRGEQVITIRQQF